MKLLHVTIQTSKFDETIEFYENFAGLSIQRDLRPMGKPIVFLANGDNETCIEIIDNPEANDTGNKYLSIGFKTEDVDAKYDEFGKLGYEPTPMQSPMPQVKFFFVKDPAGVNVQFM